MPPDLPTYVVELKAVEIHEGHEKTVSFCPQMSVLDGQHCTMCFDDHEAVLAPCAGCLAKCTAHHGCDGNELGGVVAVHVHSEDAGHVRLELDVQQTEAPQSNENGVVVLSKGMHAEQCMKVGKTTQLVLDRDADGHPHRWLEVKVCAASDKAPTMPKAGQGPTAWRRAEHLPMPKRCCSEECEHTPATKPSAEEALSSLCDWLGSLCPLETWSEPMTLPSGQYLVHPPQYFPPSPACPLMRELANQEAIPAAPAPCMPLPPPPALGVRAVVPPPPPMPMACEGRCMQQAVMRCSTSAPAQCVHGFHVSVDGDLGLVIDGGCGAHLHGKDLTLEWPGMSALHLATHGQQVCIRTGTVHACADSVHAEKGALVLEGHVHLHYSKEAFKSEVHASRIEINTSGDGSYTVKP
jgi:hypothetical protein